MLEPNTEAVAPVEGAPAVGGIQPSAGNDAPSGTDTLKLPGWIGQLTADQQAEIKARVAVDPKAVDELPKGLTELYSGYSQLKAQTVGAIKIPATDAPKEAWDQFYKGLGRPESAEGYTLTQPQIPDGMRYDEAQEKWFRGLAYAAGLNDAQAKAIFENWNKVQAENFQKFTESRKAQRVTQKVQAEATLKQLYGDKYPDKMENMRQAMAALMPEGQNGKLFKKIQAQGLDNDPDFLRLWISIGEKIGPPKMVVPLGDGKGQDTGSNWNFRGVPAGRP